MSPSTSPNRPKSRNAIRWISAILLAGAIAFILWAHPFLAVTQRVKADTLVVEGWIPSYMLPAAAREFREGAYTHLLVSGLDNNPETSSAATATEAMVTARRLITLGVPADAVQVCPAPFATWRRTAKMAAGVREKISTLSPGPNGINVLTAGPHARETWVAYEHVFGPGLPVGIISVPKTNYPADRWWLTREGLFWVTKDFIAWSKEVILTRVP